eukprot:scaffold3723_cov112-Isochrysis_galbana.AAC.1
MSHLKDPANGRRLETAGPPVTPNGKAEARPTAWTSASGVAATRGHSAMTTWAPASRFRRC